MVEKTALPSMIIDAAPPAASTSAMIRRTSGWLSRPLTTANRLAAAMYSPKYGNAPVGELSDVGERGVRRGVDACGVSRDRR